MGQKGKINSDVVACTEKCNNEKPHGNFKTVGCKKHMVGRRGDIWDWSKSRITRYDGKLEPALSGFRSTIEELL